MSKSHKPGGHDKIPLKAAYIGGIFLICAALIPAVVPDLRKSIVGIFQHPTVSGVWWGGGKDKEFLFSGSNSCSWNASISDVTLSATINSGRLEHGHLAYTYHEQPTPDALQKNCGSGEGHRTGITNNTAEAKIEASTVINDQVHIVFNGANTNSPTTECEFTGHLTDESTLKGVLVIRRKDKWAYLGIDWTEEMQVKLER